MDKKKNLKEVINGLEQISPEGEELEKIKKIAENYENKSEEEVFFEIINLNKKMEQDMDEDQYQEVFEKLESIRPLLNEEQLERLDRVLEVLRDSK